jgi:hypothetical protein
MANQATPANFLHCQAIYGRMQETAVEEIADEAGHKVTTWTGATTELFKQLNLAMPYYTKVMNKLMAMGCVTQAQRGGGGSPSKWVLHYPPELEMYESAKDKPHGRPSRRDEEVQWRRDMTNVVNNLSTRIAVLEEKVRVLNG